MKRMILFVLIIGALVLVGCGGSVPTRTPIPQAQDTPILISISAPTESSVEALSPDGEAAQQLLMVFLFQAAVKEGIRTTAADIQSKKITDMNGLGEVMANGIFLKVAGEALEKDFPAPLATFVDIARSSRQI